MTAEEFCKTDSSLQNLIFINKLEEGELDELCAGITRFAELHVKSCKEQIQMDLITHLDGVNETFLDKLCDIVVNSYKNLPKRL